MKYVVWLSEVEPAALDQLSLRHLATLTQAGFPVLPSLVLLPAASAKFLEQAPLQQIVQRELRAIRTERPALAAGSAALLRQAILTAELPGVVRSELDRQLLTLREHALQRPEQPLTVRLQLDAISRQGQLMELQDLERLVKQLYALRWQESTLLTGVVPTDQPLLIQYWPNSAAHGAAHVRDDLHGDERTVQITSHNHPTDIYRIDHKAGLILQGPEQPTGLGAATAPKLAHLIGKAQALLPDLAHFGWRHAHSRYWLDSITPATLIAPASIRTTNHGTATGLVRRIHRAEDRASLQPGDIALLDHIRPDDYRWLAPAKALVTAYGETNGVASSLAKRLGIPAISGLHPAQLDQFKNGQLITVDATSGQIVAGKTLIGTAPGLATKVLAHLDVLDTPSTLPHDGVLVTHGTSVLAASGFHPYQILRRNRIEEYMSVLTDELVAAAKAIYPRPLFYRFHDGYESGDARHRGLQLLLSQAVWLQVEVELLHQAVQRGATNLIMVTPLLRQISEIEVLRVACAPREGLLERLWVTCGTPAMAIQAPQLVAAGIQGICLDVALLAQFTLGIESANRQFGHLVETGHSAVLEQMQYTVEAAHQAGVATMISAEESVLEQSVVEAAVLAGVDYLATLPGNIAATRLTIQRTEQEVMAERLLAMA